MLPGWIWTLSIVHAQTMLQMSFWYAVDFFFRWSILVYHFAQIIPQVYRNVRSKFYKHFPVLTFQDLTFNFLWFFVKKKSKKYQKNIFLDIFVSKNHKKLKVRSRKVRIEVWRCVVSFSHDVLINVDEIHNI